MVPTMYSSGKLGGLYTICYYDFERLLLSSLMANREKLLQIFTIVETSSNLEKQFCLFTSVTPAFKNIVQMATSVETTAAAITA